MRRYKLDMENQTPLLFEDLDIRISKISNGEEEIKEEDKNISSCDLESNRKQNKKVGHKKNYITKHTDKVYSCTHCPFKSKSGLKYHFKLKHLNNDSKDYLNDGNSSLQMVERVSKVEFDSNMQFQCTECGKQYTTVIAVKTHYKREHIDKVYNCDQCPYIAKDKGRLNQHMKTTHSKKEYKEYKCEYCEQVFEHVLHLRAIKHARSPHDHSCHKCDKAFIHSNQLRKHISVNHPIIQEPKLYTITKDGRYSCNICNKQFAQNGGVNRHYRKDHLNIVHECNLCTYSATAKYDLQSHIKFRHSGIGFTCEYCQQTFQLKYALKEHLTKTHNFQCGQCDKAFVRNDQLQIHIKVYHEGKKTSHHCKICNKMVIKSN